MPQLGRFTPLRIRCRTISTRGDILDESTTLDEFSKATRSRREFAFLERRLVFVLLCSLLAPLSLSAQQPAASVGVGFGVDTATPEVRELVRLVRAYLAQPDSTARRRGLWSTAARYDRRNGDLTSDAYQGFPATVVGVSSVGFGDSVYVIKLLHARADSSSGSVMPLALQRLYALRAPSAPFGWQLAGALSRITHEWRNSTLGRVTFWYAPGQHRSPRRAAQAVRFVNYVATLFQVPVPERLDVFLTGSTEEANRAIGLDFFPEGSGPRAGRGGRALPMAGIILVGDPSVGEAYLHELAHAVIVPAFGGGTALFSEGAATWLGGSLGRSPAQMYAVLRRYQAAHPTVTFAQLLNSSVPAGWGQAETDALYASSALAVAAVYRRTGISGLRVLARVKGGPDTVLAAVARQLGLAGDSASIDSWWRVAAANTP